MKKLKLFFACLLMAVLSIGQVWGAVGDTYTQITGQLSKGTHEVLIAVGNYNTDNSATSGSSYIASDKTNGTQIALSAVTFGGSAGAYTFVCTDAKQIYTIVVDDNGDITSAKSSDNTSFSPSTSSNKLVTTASGMDVEVNGDCYRWSKTSGTNTYYVCSQYSYNLRAYKGKCGSAKYCCDLILMEVAASSDACATPTFTPAAGAVLNGTTVAIGCSTDGATIHYTTDGTDPTVSSPTYSSAITIDANKTIKAIAVKSGLSSSSVATAVYTVVEPLTTMQAIFEAATTTATPQYITFSSAWVVTGVSTNGKNVYITDGTKGMILYNGSGNMGLAVGNTLSGTVQRSLKLYNGAAELDPFTTDGLTIGTADLPNVHALDAAGIEALSGVNTGSLIKISGACTQETSKYYVAGVQLYNTLFAYANPTAGNDYNVTGVYVQYNTTKEVLPRSAADIEEVTASGAPEAPTFSVAAGEYTAVQTVELSCATDGATIYYTTDGSTPDNTKTEYTAAITVDANMTIKAIAIKDNISSSIVSAAYIINLPADPEVTCTWDLSTTSYVADPEPTADLIQWTSTYVTMKAEKNNSSTGVNNYIPPTRTSTRFYSGNKITFIPANSKQITTIVIIAATSGYATALKNATWTNATAAAGSSDTEVIVTAAGAGNVVCVLGSNTGVTAVTVNYEPYVAPPTYAVSFAAPEHGTLAIANGDDPIASGDEFVEGTELTVSAEPASGYILDAIKVIETGSDPENDVTSNVLSGTTLTVPDYAITVSATFVENVAPIATLTLSENGVTSSLAGEHHQGDVVNLPSTSSADCVKDFVGWSADANCAVVPEYAPGAEYTLASTEQTLYAVYATASGASYVKTALASIASGSEVVVTEAKTVEEVLTIWALTYNTTSKKTIASVVTESENVLDVAGLTNGFWILTKDGGNFSLTAKGTTDKLYCTATNDGVRVGEGEKNLFSINSDYMYNNGTTRFIGVQGAVDWRCYTSINSTISGQTLAFYKKTASYSDFATTCVAALADPEFTPAAGVYSEAKNIVITAEEGTIYYTLDGTEPTSGSTEYTAPIVLDENGTTTIKAIAISATSQSAVVSATYTISLPLSTIPAIFAAATSTQTEVNITLGNWVVSGVGTDGKTVYVTDGTNGFIIYNSEHGFEVGDILSGTITCDLKKYKGAAELIGVTTSTTGLTVTKGGTVTPASVAPADLAGVNTGALISLSSWQYDGSDLTDGATYIQPFTTIYDCSSSFATDKFYNVSGIYLQFDSKKEILPRSADDIEELSLVDPELSYSPSMQEIEVGDDWSAPLLSNEHGLTLSYESSNPALATVSDAGVIALVENKTGTAIITASFAGNATYAAGSATYTITVNPTGTSQNVVILATYDSKYYAMSTTIPGEAFTAIAVEYDGSKVTVNSEEDKAAIQWTKKTNGDNTTFQTKDEDKKYMKGTSGGAAMSLNANVCNWSWDETNEYYYIGSRSFFYQNGTGFKNYATSNFNKSGYSGKAQVIAIASINIVVTSKVSAELAYNPASNEITQGGAWTAPSLVNPHNVTITSYGSDNEDVATVTDGGVIALAGGIGTAKITAHFDGDETYLEGNAVYTITVNEAGDDLSGTWTLASSVAAGDKIIFMGAKDPKVYAMGKQNSNNRAAVESTLDGDVLTPGAATKVFTLVDAGEGRFAIQASNGKYLTSATSGTSNNLLEAENYDLDNAKWTISIDGESSVASIVAAAGSKTVMQYNGGSTLFSCYGSANQSPVKIFKKDATPEPTYVDVRTGLEPNHYYTICYPNAMSSIKGATLWSFIGKDAQYAYLVQETASTIEAGKPYIMYATASTVQAVLGDETNAPGANGAIHGTFNNLVQEQLDNLATVAGHDLYLVIGDELRRATGAGTGSNTLPAQRAFVVVGEIPDAPANMPAHVRRMPMQTDQAQGFENIEASDKPMKLMIDGQMYILRGEKVYDATGRLVK